MEQDLDKEERRKIQFSVPSSVSLQLDPRQVEMIRRRRPTPATLFTLTDPPSPEENGPPQWVLGENRAVKAKLVTTTTYQPPSVEEVQRLAQLHLSSLNVESAEKEDEADEAEEERSQSASTTDMSQQSRLVRDKSALHDSTPSTELRHHDRSEEEVKDRGREGKVMLNYFLI